MTWKNNCLQNKQRSNCTNDKLLPLCIQPGTRVIHFISGVWIALCQHRDRYNWFLDGSQSAICRVYTCTRVFSQSSCLKGQYIHQKQPIYGPFLRKFAHRSPAPGHFTFLANLWAYAMPRASVVRRPSVRRLSVNFFFKNLLLLNRKSE